MLRANRTARACSDPLDTEQPEATCNRRAFLGLVAQSSRPLPVTTVGACSLRHNFSPAQLPAERGHGEGAGSPPPRSRVGRGRAARQGRSPPWNRSTLPGSTLDPLPPPVLRRPRTLRQHEQASARQPIRRAHRDAVGAAHEPQFGGRVPSVRIGVARACKRQPVPRALGMTDPPPRLSERRRAAGEAAWPGLTPSQGTPTGARASPVRPGSPTRRRGPRRPSPRRHAATRRGGPTPGA